MHLCYDVVPCKWGGPSSSELLLAMEFINSIKKSLFCPPSSIAASPVNCHDYYSTFIVTYLESEPEHVSSRHIPDV